MSNSQFCIQQRQQEQQKTKRLLLLGLTGSTLLHGILVWAIPKWSLEPPQAAKPIELIIIEKPKPQPQPKVESKPIVEPEPKPAPKPEPAKSQRLLRRKTTEPALTVGQTPPPPVQPPEPVKTPTASPKPLPKKVLTTPTPAPSQPTVSAPIENTSKAPVLSDSVSAPTNTVGSAETNSNTPSVPDSAVVTKNAPPPRPESISSQGISCISNCEPEYPATLAGAEGSAGVKLTINSNGNVIGAELTTANSNSQLNREALLAARQMQFSSPGDSHASVQVKIEFTVAGSEYDRAAREAQARREQAEKERQEREAARQQQLEQERQARQEQLERERQVRQEQLQQPATTQPQPQILDTQPAAKPLPAPAENEADDQMLREFRERIEQYQKK